MTEPRRQPIPYQADSSCLYELLCDEPWAMFIDSGRPHSAQGRYDILVADPTITLITQGQMTEIRRRDGSHKSPDDPFLLVQEALGSTTPSWDDLPFCGGALGYFGYDLGRRLETLPERAENLEQLPEMAIGIYDWALVVDHQKQQSWLVSQGRDPVTAERWDELVSLLSDPSSVSVEDEDFLVLSSVRANMDRSQYAAAFEQVQCYIHEGDCYQVNLAQRFEVAVKGDPWSFYKVLRQVNPAPYGAYLNLPFVQVLSCSPERFLRVHNKQVETKPIKGTCRRGATVVEDEDLARELYHSSKNRAENLMIVDLLRNDLGKSCRPGSIQAPQLFQVETFATLHHLVSTVIGALQEGKDALDLLRGCFPGGSITGAPKLRAMQIIEELEPHRRGLYCGSIGYVGFDGNMDCNIAIRTLVHTPGSLCFWAGGGLVADSVMEEEYQESFCKAEAMLRLLKRS